MLRVAAFAIAALALFCTPATADTLNGRWTGWYICAQGPTGLTLTITGDEERGPEHRFQAHFSFYGLPQNPHVPSGAFTMSGVHTPHNNGVTLTAEDWIERPLHYETVDLAGGVENGADGEIMRGVVDFMFAPSACSVFELRRDVGAIS
jgi:hypothetical protein